MLSQALPARFADASEQRVSDRRVLRLEAQAATPLGASGIQIHNLSRTGMLVESTADVPLGAGIEVEMPGGTRHRAEVVWGDAGLFGCRFNKPLSQAALSAALLRAAPLGPPAAALASAAGQDAFVRLRQDFVFEHEIDASRELRLPLRARLWAIIGLGFASWAVPSVLVALSLA